MVFSSKQTPIIALSLLTLGAAVSIAMLRPVFAQATEDQNTTSQNEYQQLNQQIDEKKLKIEELNAKIKQYEDSLEVKRQESLTLQGQVSLIDGQIEQTQADVERIDTEIESTSLEIEKLSLDIAEREKEAKVMQGRLAEYLRLLNKYDQRSSVNLVLTAGSFSDFFDTIQYSQNIESEISDGLRDVKSAKDALEENYRSQQSKKDELKTLQDKLGESVGDLKSQQTYKTDLLDQTKQSQETFEELLAQAQLEQKQADAEIFSIERQAREKLQELGDKALLDSIATLSWPVKSSKGISAYFHDPTYLFRKYFEHPAVDIRVSQGSPVYAAADGYVSRAKNGGLGYSYIMIIHNDELSSVYGHVSRIDVSEEQFVRRGDQIGLSGGMPGTAGAGRLTTGPHLHFEVRQNGIPVNPLDYLP